MVDRIAKACHEVNRVYCRSIGDRSQPAWEDAPDWQRESTIQGVHVVLANPDITPAQQHSNWMITKLDAGWRYGPVKDPENKLHPCIRCYDRLPEDQKVKDALFGAVVKSFI